MTLFLRTNIIAPHSIDFDSRFHEPWLAMLEEMFKDRVGFSRDHAIDQIFDLADHMLCNGWMEALDAILKRIVEGSYSKDIALSFLSITCAAKSKLPNRRLLYEKAAKTWPQPKLWQGLGYDERR